MSRQPEWTSLMHLTITDTKSVVRILSLLADEADNWSDEISDGYRPLQCEPRTNYANKGSNTAYSLGDLRRARAIYVKLAGPRAAVHSNEESSPCVP